MDGKENDRLPRRLDRRGVRFPVDAARSAWKFRDETILTEEKVPTIACHVELSWKARIRDNVVVVVVEKER